LLNATPRPRNPRVGPFGAAPQAGKSSRPRAAAQPREGENPDDRAEGAFSARAAGRGSGSRRAGTQTHERRAGDYTARRRDEFQTQLLIVSEA
jgi:hypothetical protein